MILKNKIIIDIIINSVEDLYKLQPFLEDGTLKINKSHRDDCIKPFYDIISELLSDRNQQIFYYRKVLWQYLVDNHGYKGVYCNFAHYLKRYEEFESYFRKGNKTKSNEITLRYETPPGK